MTARRIYVPDAMPSRSANGRARPALLRFYEPTGAYDELKAVYTSSALTTAHEQPIESDASGHFPAIWADDAQSFDVGWFDATSGAQIKTYGALTPLSDAAAASVALAESAQAAAETARDEAEEIVTDLTTLATAVSNASTSATAAATSASAASASATAADGSADDAADSAVAAAALVAAALTDASNYGYQSAWAAATIPAALKSLKTTGYAANGDGGAALYKRVTAEPSHAGKFRSTDRYLPNGTTDSSNGGWWELAEEEVHVAMFGAVGDGSTDDCAAIQDAINFAVSNGVRRVRFGAGTYLVNGTLEVKSTSGFKSLELRGATGAFLGNTRLTHHSSQLLNPLINIQSMRATRIVDIELRGNNVAPSDAAQVGDGSFVNGDSADWVTASVSERRYAPYAGIAIDALTGADPGAGSNYTFGTYGQTSSSKLVIERCRVQNFLVGVAVGPRNSDSGTEDILLRECMLIENKYAVVTTGSQQRNVVVEDGNVNGAWCAFDNVTFGQQIGQPITIKGGLATKTYRLFQTSVDIGVLNVEALYCESVATLGFIGKATSSSFATAHFSGCNFSLVGVSDDGVVVNKDDTLKSNLPVVFSGCVFNSWFMLTLSPDKPVTFDGCAFRCEGNATDTTPGERENFGIYVPEGKEHRIIMRGCEQRTYSGTTKLLDNEARVYSLPTRAYVMPHTMRVSRVSNKTNYKLGTVAVTRTATISTVSYVDAETITFTETTSPAFIMEGDVIDWRVNLPVVPGASGETANVPALRVTDVTGTTITCKITGNVDTTYSPTSAFVRVRQFINGTTSTGDTTNGSADVTNVTNASNFQVGDWIYFSDTGINSANPVRITAIVSTTITCHRTLSKTTTGVSIYNTLLTAI